MIISEVLFSGYRGQIRGDVDKKSPRRVVGGGNGDIEFGTDDLQKILRVVESIGRSQVED